MSGLYVLSDSVSDFQKKKLCSLLFYLIMKPKLGI